MDEAGQLDTDYQEDMDGSMDREREPIEWVMNAIAPENAVNLCGLLDDSKLSEIGAKVVKDYQIDKDSRSDWEALMDRAMKLAKQVVEEKNFPWPNASNVKYPLLTTAAIQFAARAYPEIVKGDGVVKGKVIGYDPDNRKAQRADRISRHMSYQCMEEMHEWDEDTDKLLHVLPIMGVCFRKSYFDPIKGRNVSEMVLPDDLVVHYYARCLEDSRRVSHLVKYHANDVYEFVQVGLWRDVDLGKAQDDQDHASGDDDALHEFIEQHRFLDLDDDKYQEPYIVTVNKATSQVVRIVPRFDREGIFVTQDGKIAKIDPVHYFTKYSFIPNPDGSFYDLGFGWLLGAIGETINTLINQLLDAGTVSNLGGGFISRGIRIKSQSQTIRMIPGEFKPVDAAAQDLRQGIMPLPVPNPSPVLFQLLGMLVEAAKEISSVSSIMTGESPGQNVPATTTLAMVEQGLKVFSAIHKRIFRSLKSEFKKLYRLNSIYLPAQAEFTVLDVPQAISQQDYSQEGVDVLPVADPNMSTDVLRMAKSQALMAISGRPGVNEDAVTAQYLDSIKMDAPERFIIPPEQRPQMPPDPKMIEVQDKIQENQARFQMDAQKHELEMELLRAQIEQTRSTAIKNVAQAEAAEIGMQLEQYKLIVDQLSQRVLAQTDILKELIRGENARKRANAGQSQGTSGMESASSDQGAFQGAQIDPQQALGAIGLGNDVEGQG